MVFFEPFSSKALQNQFHMTEKLDFSLLSKKISDFLNISISTLTRVSIIISHHQKENIFFTKNVKYKTHLLDDTKSIDK